MADPGQSSTSITDLDTDCLVHCASFLSLRDVCSMAMACKPLHTAAYSDSIWQSLYRQQWPRPIPSSYSQASTIREAYIARHTAVQQFKYVDPQVVDVLSSGKCPKNLLLDKDDVIFSQGPVIQILHTGDTYNGSRLTALGSHKARVSCIRLFHVGETSLDQSQSDKNDNVIVSSSCDHTIRLWWKGGCQRCFKGHNGPVTTLSDKLLGDGTGQILASGGEDGTVRLWSINFSGKRGQHALKATFYGHEKALLLMSVAGYKPSLLVSLSKNSKMRVWDTAAASSSIRSSCCVGMAAIGSPVVGMKCHESLVYVAAGSSVVTIDLRTMHRVSTISQEAEIHSFQILPSKSLICTGGFERAMLYDIRRVASTAKAESIVELEGHIGPIEQIHMDPYKIVTGGPDDSLVKVWETDTGNEANSLTYYDPDDDFVLGNGCSSIAVDGSRLVTAGGDEGVGTVLFRDFTTAIHHVSSHVPVEGGSVLKFWDPQSYSDSKVSD